MSTHVDDFWVLHSTRLDASGYPALREGLVSHLDQGQPTGASGPLSLAEARARLAVVAPESAAVVDLCSVQGMTVRAAAALLGLDHVTVWRRKERGLTLLAGWTHDPRGRG